ncbi:sensor histidine kinase [Gimesia aquarii]|uniref:histidine kinase n=1 Tax=Gimesia aquarii TaxID=2527964 RepID=A0A517X386_9PLAN|nr:HAMP domain-containing sensor histidine kinase [Gimesia aquarii]QDU11960.1 Sporulation kinase A [Gimesia aquarii]
MMRWPLRYQILIPMVGIMVCAIVSVTLLHAYLSTNQIKLQIRDQFRQIAHTLNEATFPLTEAVLNQTKGLSGADFVLVGKNDEVLASTRPDFVPQAVAVGPPMWNELQISDVLQTGDAPFFHTVVKIQPRSPTQGQQYLHIYYPAKEYRDALSNAIYPSLIAGSVALAVVAFLATVIAARVTRPLQRLDKKVAQIAHGDFQPMILPIRNDEIRDLSISINQMAELLGDYEDEIKRSERLKTLGQIRGAIAHQLRNAVTGCRIALDLHLRKCAESQDETLQVANRQLSMIEQYLQSFLENKGGDVSRFGPICLNEIISKVVSLVMPTAKHFGINLENNAASDSITVQGDSEALEQLISNLILNAIEAVVSAESEKDLMAGDVGQVSIRLFQSSPESVTLEVQDTGAGPDSKIISKMYEPLVTDKKDGTGLGLFVARKIVKNHAGQIRWERQDRTTCFVVELPLVNAEKEHVEITNR